MWMPPDLGNQYARELERKQREEAYLREGRTGKPSYFLRAARLGIGQKLLLLGVGFFVLLLLLIVWGSLTSSPDPLTSPATNWHSRPATALIRSEQL